MVVAELQDARAESFASRAEASLNLLIVFSLIIEVRKPGQLAGLIRVILGWILKPFPSSEKPCHRE